MEAWQLCPTAVQQPGSACQADSHTSQLAACCQSCHSPWPCVRPVAQRAPLRALPTLQRAAADEREEILSGEVADLQVWRGEGCSHRGHDMLTCHCCRGCCCGTTAACAQRQARLTTHCNTPNWLPPACSGAARRLRRGSRRRLLASRRPRSRSCVSWRPCRWAGVTTL